MGADYLGLYLRLAPTHESPPVEVRVEEVSRPAGLFHIVLNQISVRNMLRSKFETTLDVISLC
jgi:hypothetical protein